MTMKNNINLKNVISLYLKSIPETRDDDNYLIYLICRYNFEYHKKNGYTIDFLNDIRMGKVVNFDYIKRIRRRLQEKHPELRGETYDKRKGKKQEEFKDHIKNIE